MNAYQLKFWPALQRDPDIKSQNSDRLTDISLFAAVVQQHPNCTPLYRNPLQFFNATYLTAELKQLFKEVLGGLCGEGNQIFSLVGDRTVGHSFAYRDFSETFLSLYHLTKHRQELSRVPQFFHLPNPESVQVAALTAFDLDIDRGIEVEPGLNIFTPWGYLAWQLGGSFAYSLLKIHDEQRVAPSEYLLRHLIGDRPTLILLEDFLEYVHRAIEILGTDDPFLPQILTFIENIIAVIEKSSNTVLVYSLSTTNEGSLLTAIENSIAPQQPINPDNYIEPENYAFLEESEINPKIQESISETAEAIAVVSLDEKTYRSRSVPTRKRRQKTGSKIWTVKSDRPTLSQETAMPCPYRNGGNGGAIVDIPTLYQWHKRSEIDLAINQLFGRSPPE